jgi:hypothetical protein
VSPAAIGNGQKVQTTYDQLLERVKSIPGIQSAAQTFRIPLREGADIGVWSGHGPAPPPNEQTGAVLNVVSPDYARTMRIPLLRGRFFTAHDNPSSPRVAVVDQVLAQQVFPGEDPLGKEVSVGLGLGTLQIVGLVGHVRQWTLASEGEHGAPRNQIYFAFAQIPDQLMRDYKATNLVLRTNLDPLSVLSQVSRQVQGPGKDQPVYDVATMEQIMAKSMAEQRFVMHLLGPVRRRGSVSDGGRHLRSNVLRRRSARARDRDSDGAGSRPPVRADDGAGERHDPGFLRCRRRNGRRLGPDAPSSPTWFTE